MEILRVASLNLWNRSGPWASRLGLVRAEIARLGLDLLGVQEALRLGAAGVSADGVGELGRVPDATDQCSEVGAGLFSHVAYAGAWDMGEGLTFGNGLLSRWPLRDHRTFLLPGRESGETRSLLFARAEHPLGSVPVFVTHLNWKLHHGSVRLRQVEFIVDRVKELCPIDSPDLPPVLMGDFNADPDSDEVRFLRGLATVGGRSVYFADAWTYGGDGSPGYTFDRRNRFAALAHEPPRRIDYVFVRGPDRMLRGEPVRAALAFDRPAEDAGGPVWPSDHFGVVADLAISPRSL